MGQDIQLARKKRRMTVDDFAERLGVAKGTVIRLERGEPGTSMGTLAMALLALGELHRINDLIDASRDDAGLILDRDNVPERVRRPRTTSGRKAQSKESDSDPEGFGF